VGEKTGQPPTQNPEPGKNAQTKKNRGTSAKGGKLNHDGERSKPTWGEKTRESWRIFGRNERGQAQ